MYIILYTHICITESLCCTPETNKNIINQLYFDFTAFFLKLTTILSILKRTFPHFSISEIGMSYYGFV